MIYLATALLTLYLIVAVFLMIPGVDGGYQGMPVWAALAWPIWPIYDWARLHFYQSTGRKRKPRA